MLQIPTSNGAQVLPLSFRKTFISYRICQFIRQAKCAKFCPTSLGAFLHSVFGRFSSAMPDNMEIVKCQNCLQDFDMSNVKSTLAPATAAAAVGVGALGTQVG